MHIRLSEPLYGLAYRNHRYELDEYNISFFPNKALRDEFYNQYILEVETECLKFQFKIKDLMRHNGN